MADANEYFSKRKSEQKEEIGIAEEEINDLKQKAPEKINITTVGKLFGNFKIATKMGVNKGSNWTWYNPYYEAEVMGESYYTFTNIPGASLS